MSLTNHLPTIAIINNNLDFLDLMQRMFNAEGFVSVTLSMAKVKTGEINLVDFISGHDPEIIVYDVAFPYKENWKQWQNVKGLDVCRDREFILTTPNIDALIDQIGQEVGAHQLIDKDIDLSKVVSQVMKIWNDKYAAHSTLTADNEPSAL